MSAMMSNDLFELNAEEIDLVGGGKLSDLEQGLLILGAGVLVGVGIGLIVVAVAL